MPKLIDYSHKNLNFLVTGCILLCLTSILSLRAQSSGYEGLPADTTAKRFVTNEDGSIELIGDVTIQDRGRLFQADRITYRDNRTIEATGNVLVVWEENRISGSQMTYDLETEHGTMLDTVGEIGQDYIFRAERAELRGKDKVYVEGAEVTSCTQPVPYWSFRVARANITINKYARMWHVRLKTGRMPVVYLPYLLWPVKEDRAMGLLLPEFSNTRVQGRSVRQDLFIPLGRSADATVSGRYFTKAGFGVGTEIRALPNANGSAKFDGFWIRDETQGSVDRYRLTYEQTQTFRNGFRMLADINILSDFNFSSDFDRDLGRVSSPTILARLEFSRNYSWTSLNIRELRREQLFIGGNNLVQRSLPEIEFRGRPKKLGKTPLYLGFQSSLASLQQFGTQQGLPIDADYWRADLFPEFSMPISQWPWLDITPRVRYRVTHYTQSQEIQTDPISGATSRDVLDQDITRSLFGADLQITGPKFFKVYNTPNNAFSPKFKHTLESVMSYGYSEVYDEDEKLLLFDEVDRFRGNGPGLTYGLTSRLFAKRRRSPSGIGGSLGRIILPNGTEAQATFSEDPDTSGPLGADEGETVEIASLTLRQRRSFDQDLVFADLDRDGINEETSPYSNLDLTARFNPTRSVSLDLRSSYHILYDRVSSVSLSGAFRNPRSLVEFSMVHREGLGVVPISIIDPGTGLPITTFEPRPDDTQIRLLTGASLFRNKLRVFFDGSFDANPAPGGARLPNKGWRVEYSTQCCSFMVEKLGRTYSTLDERNDLTFRIDLKGVGKLFDYGF